MSVTVPLGAAPYLLRVLEDSCRAGDGFGGRGKAADRARTAAERRSKVDVKRAICANESTEGGVR